MRLSSLVSYLAPLLLLFLCNCHAECELGSCLPGESCATGADCQSGV